MDINRLIAQKYSKSVTECDRERYIDWIIKVGEKAICPLCKTNMRQNGKWKWKCDTCKCGIYVKNKSRPRDFIVDMGNPNNWRTTCEECGKKAKFYNSPSGRMAYICDYCNWVLEV